MLVMLTAVGHDAREYLDARLAGAAAAAAVAAAMLQL
jgi:hypothetical protein